MIKISIKNFDIQKICNSGQCFRMMEIEPGTYGVIAFDTYLEITQKEDEILFSCSKEEFDDIWMHYFGLKDDYDSIENLIQDDAYMKSAMTYGYGIRILKQDVWEIIVSFLISQQNNIPRIKKSIQLLCERYGEKKVNYKGEVYYTFPRPEVLKNLEDSDLKSCNLGYRSKYILETAKVIAGNQTYIQDLINLSYEEAKKELMKLYGVGIKVAECICLYALLPRCLSNRYTYTKGIR